MRGVICYLISFFPQALPCYRRFTILCSLLLPYVYYHSLYEVLINWFHDVLAHSKDLSLRSRWRRSLQDIKMWSLLSLKLLSMTIPIFQIVHHLYCMSLNYKGLYMVFFINGQFLCFCHIDLQGADITPVMERRYTNRFHTCPLYVSSPTISPFFSKATKAISSAYLNRLNFS